MKVKKMLAFIGAAGLLLTGITFIGCSISSNGDSGTSGGSITEESIQGVWEIKKIGDEIYPKDPTNGSVPGAKGWLYYCFNKGIFIPAGKIDGMSDPNENGLFKGPSGTYEILSGNNVKTTIGSDSGILSLTLSGDTLTSSFIWRRSLQSAKNRQPYRTRDRGSSYCSGYTLNFEDT